MNTNTIDAALCAKMFLTGASNLESKKEWINELNVFPVPDGDTGTNMTLTIMSAVREVSALESLTMATFSEAVSSGSLRGARGNSGVILSQLLRGFTKVIRTEEEITPVILAAALQKAVETAYKAVMKPKEGTILTVARGGAERAFELVEENPDIELEILMREVVERSEQVLAQTPELLPVLEEAGVVDSGGQGLVQVLKGALDAFCGVNGVTSEESKKSSCFVHQQDTPAGGEDDFPLDSAKNVAHPDSMDGTDADGEAALQNDSDQEVPQSDYCVEFVLLPEGKDMETFSSLVGSFWERCGSDLVLSEASLQGALSEADGIYAHIHTNNPGIVLQNAQMAGMLTQIRIRNLRLERCVPAKEASSEPDVQTDDVTDPFALPGMSKIVEMKETGFISVSIGDGIADIFRDLGVDYLIEGGQTMNPSTEDMLNAISQVNAKNIFVLPNNKNIILAANQAKSMTKDKNIFVIPTRTVPQGITAVINYVPEKTPEENAVVMEQEIENVKTGQLTYAVRDTHIENMVISAGDIMGVGDHSILAVGKEIDSVAAEAVAKMMTGDAELISIYYGEDMKEMEAQAFCDQITEQYPDCDVELNYGGQPIYYYIISVE